MFLDMTSRFIDTARVDTDTGVASSPNGASRSEMFDLVAWLPATFKKASGKGNMYNPKPSLMSSDDKPQNPCRYLSLCVYMYIYISVYSLLANSCFWMQELWTELLQFGVQSTQVRTKKTPTTNNLFFFCHLHSTLDGCIAVFHRGNSSWRSPKVSCREVLESCGTSLVEAQQMSTWRSWWNLRLLVKRGWWQVHSIYISPLSKYR